MKRFDIIVEGHYPSISDRGYCTDGEFVDADVAQEMVDALEQTAEWLNGWASADEPHLAVIEKALFKARGYK